MLLTVVAMRSLAAITTMTGMGFCVAVSTLMALRAVDIIAS